MQPERKQMEISMKLETCHTVRVLCGTFFGGAAYYQDNTHDKDCETQTFYSENKCEKCTINMLRLRLC